MSNWTESNGSVPPRWLHCPRKAVNLIQNKFLAFKTPLSSAFDNQVPEECRFTVNMLFASLKSQRLKLGLWIDLTNTSRFYDKKSLETYGCKYLKLQCRGHGETPSKEQTKTFIQVCKNFISHNPLEIIGVHCTHGFNRTGFLIVSYLVETDGSSVDAALAEFATARPPGIYKVDYIQELFRRYDDVEDAPDPPPRPAWCLEYDDSNIQHTITHDEQGPSKKRRSEFNNKNPIFMAGVPGVTVVSDYAKLRRIQKRVQKICGWISTGFPGSQPVSMDEHNIGLLHAKPYMVSWKADGTRYMMFIQEDGEVFFVDRNNSVFLVSKMTFPHPKETSRTLKDTLLDGEMVIDKVFGKEYPRYLAYDVIMYDGKDVSQLPFFRQRFDIIDQHIVGGRKKAMKEGRLQKEVEPFSIRSKHFWDVTYADTLLSDKFAKQLGHEPDGLIFQPAEDPYYPGISEKVLKWKPLSLNSVDFKLKIVTESGEGIVPRKVGHLYVGGSDMPYGIMEFSKQIKGLDNAIIECKYENGKWVFMRERTDKSFPNSVNTALSVCRSIKNPITTEILLNYIKRDRFRKQSNATTK